MVVCSDLSPFEAKRRRALRGLFGVVVLATVAGCAGPALIPGEGPAFERAGRFAVTATEAGRQPDAVQGGFSWRDDGRALQLDLVNPLGSTLARVQVEPSGATLQKADGTLERAPDPDTLLARVLGTALPVANLRDWLQGRTGPGATKGLENDEAGRPVAFQQDGWNVQLSRYDAVGPGLLRLDRRDGTRRISVRLAIDTQTPR